MLIRSQDKTKIFNFDNIECVFSHGKSVRIGVNNDSMDIATYSTEEKAIKVLDMIENAYSNMTFVDGVTFQMPQDSEV